ncbi:MAG: TadE family protein [Dehalococcoidia bacterium]
MKRIFRRLRHEAGQSAIEFALMLIPFMFLFMAILDAGLYFIQYVGATNAVRERARCAVVGGAMDSTAVLEDIGPETPTHTFSPDPPEVGGSVKISLEWTYEWIAPIELLGLSGTTTRTSESTMRLETDEFDKDCS